MFQNEGLADSDLVWTGGNDLVADGTYEWSNGDAFTSTFQNWKQQSGASAASYVLTDLTGFTNKPAGWPRNTRPDGILCMTKRKQHEDEEI